jgi:hypothetical protein
MVCPYCKGKRTQRYDGSALKCICTIGHGPPRKPCVVAVPRIWRERIIRDDETPPLPTREECRDGQRPCPFVLCKYHLYLDVLTSGRLRFNFPHLRPWHMQETCALDIAERGGATLEVVAQACNVTRERVRQLEVEILAKLRKVVSDER